MCVTSMIYDYYDDKWNKKIQEPKTIPYVPGIYKKEVPNITPEEIEEFRILLERAREYDKRNNEPECEIESKKQKLRDLAK